jgi:hypothetical protein
MELTVDTRGVRHGSGPELRVAQRQLATALGSGATDALGSLEAMRSATEPPRLVDAPVLEGHAMRAHRILGPAVEGFAAFLDGTQTSRVIGYDDGMPIVHGTVAAAIRDRRNRRFATWGIGGGPLVQRRVYAPLEYLSPRMRDTLLALGDDVVDTLQPDREGATPPAHPIALLERAVHLVQADRERAERELAERWCRTERRSLFVDGGIQSSDMVATATCVAGIVKSHRTLYVEGDALRLVFGLRERERSSVFRIANARRAAVASWYLRLRNPDGHDPMWSLVRVEAADRRADESPESLGERADAISRWVLAEVAPIALPDPRWDKMVYPIRDCEQFLAALR